MSKPIHILNVAWNYVSAVPAFAALVAFAFFIALHRLEPKYFLTAIKENL